VSIGTLRSHIGSQLAIADASTHHFLWVHPFPMFERTPEGGWTFSHNPFSGPLTDADLRLLETDPGKARSTQYDMVVDGNELGGGSIRIHNRAVQERVFELMGISKAEAATRFGALLDALEYGAPPEGGIATGMDRTVMILAGLANARETIAFPKTQTGYDPLLDAPAELSDELLEELGLRVIKKPPKA
jgi:aspartyl-tRNA synthetase